MSPDLPSTELRTGAASLPVSTTPSIPDWKTALQGEREQEYFKAILRTIEQERATGQIIYPPNADIFNALALTSFEHVRVVILGQDPYHGPNQAHGLSFSVQRGIPPPPSLVNIFKEIQADLGVPPPPHGCLEDWAKRGVLLLNATLTVRAGEPQSHAHLGWERFTDTIIRVLNERREHLVFMLWGASAQKKGAFIDRHRHCVLTAPHPSPLSAHRGFLGCKHFSRANTYLESVGLPPIDWRLL